MGRWGLSPAVVWAGEGEGQGRGQPRRPRPPGARVRCVLRVREGASRCGRMRQSRGTCGWARQGLRLGWGRGGRRWGPPAAVKACPRAAVLPAICAGLQGGRRRLLPQPRPTSGGSQTGRRAAVTRAGAANGLPGYSGATGQPACLWLELRQEGPQAASQGCRALSLGGPRQICRSIQTALRWLLHF
ncbi:unnamed protein product [Rangifer tarandus platyrhynchus]|uniref:Uncharacterized protein n=2 Tax=Rangifer tarandus platyrhynchus TaxID=3082113 RepID=A0ABN8ZVS5_RANTA|nr:unnamed protein product [Rangifer tarandus platyrhynchus]CAI9711837.1 unnamed protein product [Rangifer tarandus platyrhynchus]